MKLSNLNLITLKNKPSDAEIVSHQLMLRSGMIKKLASGLYTWMPLGYKVLKKMNFTTSDIDKMANYKDTDGLEVSAAAQKWLDEHKSKWSKWVK